MARKYTRNSSSEPWRFIYGRRNGLDSAKKIFEGNSIVEMDNVIFLSAHWEKPGMKIGLKFETEIKDTLRNEIESGLMFGRLPYVDHTEAWWLLDRLIDLWKEEQISGKDLIKRNEWEYEGSALFEQRFQLADKRTKEDQRVKLIQQEIGELHAGLDKTEHGKEIRAKLKVSEDQKKAVEPFLLELNREGNAH